MEGIKKKFTQPDLSNEEVVELWKKRIESVLEKGNTFSGVGEKIPTFSSSFTREEMIFTCLVRIASVVENKHYTVYHVSPKSEVIRIGYYEDEELKFRDTTDIIEQMKKTILDYNQPLKDK